MKRVWWVHVAALLFATSGCTAWRPDARALEAPSPWWRPHRAVRARADDGGGGEYREELRVVSTVCSI
jgi:hypothetical protein